MIFSYYIFLLETSNCSKFIYIYIYYVLYKILKSVIKFKKLKFFFKFFLKQCINSVLGFLLKKTGKKGFEPLPYGFGNRCSTYSELFSFFIEQ